MLLIHLMVLPACWASLCGQAVKKSHTCGIIILRRSSRMYFGASFVVYTCHVRKITYYAPIVGKNDNIKNLTMHLTKYLGMSTFKKGVIWGVFVLSWLVRVARNEIGHQYIKCDQFFMICTIACRLYNFYKDQIISTNLGYFYQRYVAV
ncbi:hypothetical protein AB205_0103940, partial [Aquarana catesbeiana]